MKREKMIIKGNLVDCDKDRRLRILKNGYLVWEKGIIEGVYAEGELPDYYRDIPIKDYRDKLILPGITDLHIHAPQYTFRALGGDMELLDWLNTYTFPEESRYDDPVYAKSKYTKFVHDLKNSFTCRACIFATLHIPATEILMDLLEESGLVCMVGKVNMDRNCIDALKEKDAETSVRNTKSWIKESRKRYIRTKPILTPRFIPSCSDDLLRGIADIMEKDKLPLQSHLSENPAEIKWVSELCPDSSFYLDAYDKRGVLAGDENCPVIMAHCVHSSEEEINLIRERGVFIAHCPQSNTNLSSGIAPLREFLNKEINVGLGSDIAAGHSISMLRIAAEAISVSKLRWRLLDKGLKPLTLEEAFYVLTRGGGAFFGKAGAFEKGFEADAVVLDDESIREPSYDGLRERLERAIYLSESIRLADKYVGGRRINI